MNENDNYVLNDFIERAAKSRQKYETLYAYHVAAYNEAGIELPYSADETWLNVTVQNWNSESQEYDVDIEASKKAIAKVADWAVKRSDAIVTKHWTDEELKLEVLVTSLDETTSYRVIYKVAREAVCKKKVVGYEEVPEYVRPAHTKEIVEWECEDVSLLKIAKAATA